MPRSVPFWALSELLTCTNRETRPAAANSFSQKARAKKPRSSPRFSTSIRKAPGMGGSLKIMGFLGSRAGSAEPVHAVLERAEADELIALEVLLAEPVLDHLAVQLVHAGG